MPKNMFEAKSSHGLQPVGEASNWNHSPRAVGGTQRLRHGLFSNQGLRFGALDEVEHFIPEFLPGKSLRFMKGFLHESNNFVSGYGWDGRGEVSTSEVFKGWVLHVHRLAVKDAYRGVRIDETVSEARVQVMSR